MDLLELTRGHVAVAVRLSSAKAIVTRGLLLRSALCPCVDWPMSMWSPPRLKPVTTVMALVPLVGDDPLPFSDGPFDLLFCSSVLEHQTGP